MTELKGTGDIAGEPARCVRRTSALRGRQLELPTQSRPSPLERRGRKADVDDPSCSVRRPQRN